MFQGTVGDRRPIRTSMFQVVVEVEEGGPTDEQICQKLVDGLLWVEGVGRVDADFDFSISSEGTNGKENDSTLR